MRISVNQAQMMALKAFGTRAPDQKMSLSKHMREAIGFLTLDKLKQPLMQLVNALDEFIRSDDNDTVDRANKVRSGYFNLESIVGQLKRTNDESKFTAIHTFIDEFTKVFPLDSIERDIDSSRKDLNHHFLPDIIEEAIGQSKYTQSPDAHKALVINTARLLEILDNGTEYRERIDQALTKIGVVDASNKLKLFINLFFTDDLIEDSSALSEQTNSLLDEIGRLAAGTKLIELVEQARGLVLSLEDGDKQLLNILLQFLSKKIEKSNLDLRGEINQHLEAMRNTDPVSKLKSFAISFYPSDGPGPATVRGAGLGSMGT